MASTPASTRKSGRARSQRSEAELPADLVPYSAGERSLLVPRWVFPKEAAPAGFRGWEARVTGVERQREDGLHVFVEFEDASQYHFPVDELRRWIAGGVGASRKAAPPSPAKSGRGAAAGSVRSPAKSPAKSPVKSPVKAAAAANRSPAKPARAQQQDEQGTAAVTQQEEEEAPAPPKSARRSARKPAATSSRTAATPSRRRTAAAARTLAATEEEGEQQQQEQAAAAGAAAGTPASKAAAQEGGGDAAAERPSSARQRAGGKRKHSAVGTTDSGPGKRREAEGGAAVAVDQEPGWVDKAADAFRQTLYSGAAVGVAYALLRSLYPQLEAVAP